ncbi:hypothetical protein ACFLTO_01490 [Chloroflexota bacterium]
MIEGTINPIKVITRAWDMGIKGVILVVVWGFVAVVAVYSWYWFGIDLGALGLTAVWVVPIGFFIILGVWVNSARLSVTFGGGARSGREDIGESPYNIGGALFVGDSPYNVGGAIFEYVFTIRNTGGKKLTLEPKLVLRDRKTNEKLCEADMMADFPLPKQRAIQDRVGEPNWKIPVYCPNLIPLKPEDTEKYSVAFHIDKFMVDLVGVDEKDTIRVFNAEGNLKFIDRGRKIAFECTGNVKEEARCIKSRIH